MARAAEEIDMRLPWKTILGIAALSVGCSGGGGGGGSSALSVRIDYPPAVSWTDSQSITVTGTASDRSGVASIEVNGVAATTTDGFATWEATVPLALGPNLLTVAAEDARGTAYPMAASVEIRSEDLMIYPNGLATHNLNGMVSVMDGSRTILAMDSTTGARVRISDESNTGPRVAYGIGIARDGDRLLIADRGNPTAVLAVDLATGDRSIVSDATIGVGPLNNLLSITVDGNRALVGCDSGLLSVDLSTGDRTTVSSRVGGSQRGIVVDGDRAIVLERAGFNDVVAAIDLTTGDRTNLSGDGVGTGPDLDYPQTLALDGGRVLVVEDGFSTPGAVLAVDLATGDRTILSGMGVGTGPELRNLGSILIEGGRALVGGTDGVLSIDLVTGDRSVVSPRASVGDGEQLSFPMTLAVEQDQAFVLDDPSTPGLNVVSVDLNSGDRQIVPVSSTGSGLFEPEGMTLNGDHLLVVGSTFDFGEALFRIDPTTGDLAIVSGAGIGGGILLENPRDVAVEGGRALVLGDSTVSLYTVDLVTGHRGVLSGEGPRWEGGLALAVEGDRALVAGWFDGGFGSALFSVDLSTGDRSILSDADHGSGPDFYDVRSISMVGDRAYVLTYDAIYSVDLTTGDRTALCDTSDDKGPGSAFRRLGLAGDRLLMVDEGLRALIAVDRIHGQRTIVSR